MMRQRLSLKVAALLLALLWEPMARAEISGLAIAVHGLACPFCAYGVEKKLRKVEGVQTVSVDLKSGIARIKLSYTAHPLVTELRKAVEKAGFTAGEIRLTAIGTISTNENKAKLHLRGSDGVYSLVLEEHRSSPAYLATWDQLRQWEAQGVTFAVTGILGEGASTGTTLSIAKLDRLHSLTLAIKGMSCEKCAERLSHLLEQENGVYRAMVSFAGKAARIESIGEPLNPANLMAVVENAGFKAAIPASAARP